MANYEALYNRAMAHNAMLRAHASEFVNCNNWDGSRFTNLKALERLHDTLNATETVAHQCSEDCVDTYAQCKTCFAKTDVYEAPYSAHLEAIEMWNTRTSDYDRAMAHNTILREALHDLYTEHPSTTWSEDVYVLKALNATKADLTAWKEAFAKKAVEAYLGEGAYPKVCAEAAQIAANRDMLREELECISEELAENHIEDIKRDPRMLAARLRKVRDMADLVLAQPNAAVEKYKNQIIRDYSIDSGLYKLFDYLQKKNLGKLGEQYAVNALNTLIELDKENGLLKRDLNDYNHSANLLLAAKDYKEKFGKDKRYEIQKHCGWSGLKHALKQALKIN